MARKLRRKKPLMEFAWRVPDHGFAWVDPDGGEFGRCLVEVERPYAVWETPWENSRPLADKPALFRNFAELDASEEAIRKFASTHGSLGVPEKFQVDRMPMEGEPHGRWIEEIETMRHAVALWKGVSEDDRDDLMRTLELVGGWDQWQRKAFQEMWSKAGSFVATEGIAADRAQFVNENAPKRNSRFVIQMLCNGKLRQHAVPCILEDVEFMDERNEYAFALHVVPENLLGAMWIQFAQSVGGNVDFRHCGACQEWFRVSPDVRRGHARYCGDACRMKSYRRRMERARRMHAEGVALERIAEELGTTDETVRGWLFGKAGTTQ